MNDSLQPTAAMPAWWGGALAAGGATVLVQCGTYGLAWGFGAGGAGALMAALAAGAVWTAVAAPVLAADCPDALGALLRAAAVADATLVLLALAALTARTADGNSCLSLAGAAKVYCILAAMALATTAATRCAATAWGRAAAASAAAIILTAALTTPLWMAGTLVHLQGSARRIAVDAAVHLNPFYGLCAAVVERTGFVWHQAPVMYRLRVIGEYVIPPPPRWWTSAAAMAAAAIVLAGAAAVRSVLRRRQQVAQG